MANGKIKEFIKKVGGVLPEAVGIGIKLATGNITGAIGDVGALLKSKAIESDKAKVLLAEFEQNENQWRLEAYDLEVKDRQGARGLFASDSLIQKVFSIVFLLMYGFMVWYMIEMVTESVNLPKLAETLIVMIFTATSTKLNTIIDFFFGGSVKK